MNEVKSSEIDHQTGCSIKFPVHHKYRRSDLEISAHTAHPTSITLVDIERIVGKAYHQAASLMNALDISAALEKHELNDFKKLNAFVFKQLTSKSTVDYSYFNEEDLRDEQDENTDIDPNGDDETVQNDFENDDDPTDEEDGDEYQMVTSKETFEGMRIFDKINPSRRSHYFRITINDKPKFLHKQTAVRLLSTTKNRLSSDRALRIQRTRKQQ